MENEKIVWIFIDCYLMVINTYFHFHYNFHFLPWKNEKE